MITIQIQHYIEKDILHYGQTTNILRIKRASVNALHYLELFDFFKFIKALLHGFDPYKGFVNASLSSVPVLLQCSEA